ncbi:PAS domain S-box protein [Pseudomonas sp. UL073]|uniref:histidine kinase n=1 Tax=Zestomonas insulae TaxID=2809017 RepID=A0ABS2IJ92_9GAMM|nr:PAS domain-containing sensor histidine kinase [Pseudomonas insulae]MBM7061923.1 PAS domain S-box protein [Pseudomonas insulae]
MAADVTSNDDGLYRQLVDAVTDYALYMLDPTGRIISWNPGAQRFKGYTQAEILGEHFSRFYTEEDRAAGMPARSLRIAMEDGRFESEGWRVRKDGERFWAHVVIDPVIDPSGRHVGFAKITRDLTEKKIAQEALQRSEQQFRLLVQGVTDYAIYMLDPNGIITNWNAGAQRIKGYLPEEIIGEHFSRFYTEEDRAKGEPQRGLATALADGRFEKEGWRVRKDGTRFWANVVVDPIRDPYGNLIGFAKITRDITEAKQAQEALEQTRAALFQSQKMEALGQLTGGIAHDFNNLLMAILGSLELLRKRLPDEPKVNRLLDNALVGAQRGATLTQRLLAFSRRQQLDTETVHVPELVEGMTDLLLRSLGPNVQVETSFPPALTPVKADVNQLELALINLATNARDAMPHGGRIVIAACNATIAAGDPRGMASGSYVCLSVQDNGEGMDEATLARAVEPFYTTKGVGKGTGLGLSIVHGLAEQLGGKLRVLSRLGVGTTVEIWLPVAPCGADERPVISAAPRATHPLGYALKVLVVDDDSLVLHSTQAMLEDLGCSVQLAESGREALALLHAGSVDVVITDHAMPGMTGSELARAIGVEWPTLPVVLATGFVDQLEPANPDETGLPVLRKPYGQQDLARMLGTLHPAPSSEAS